MIDNILVLTMMICAGVATTCAMHGYFVERPRRRVYAFGVSYAMCAVAIGIGFLVNGCGAPPIRTAAQVSHVLHIGMDTSGDLIAEQTQREVDRCTDQACIDHVGVTATQVAALHDAAAPLVDAYRDEVLLACGVDPGNPEAVAPDNCPQPADTVWQRIERLGAEAIAAIPDFVTALRAFGVTPPAELLGGAQ